MSSPAVSSLLSFPAQFTKWKKKKDIPAYDIMLRDADTALTTALLADPSQLPKGQLPDKLVIPESLLPKPTDSEKQKQAKLKKIKQLKSQFNRRKKELEGEEKQQAWLRFSKGHGILNRKSIFASPDTVEGKVGVTGSGKGMTQFAERKQFFNLKAAPPSIPIPGMENTASTSSSSAATPPPLPLSALGFTSAAAKVTPPPLPK